MPRRLLALCASGLLLGGCWVPIDQGQAMEADLVKMKAELNEQRRILDETSVRNDREREIIRKEQAATLARVDAKIAEVTDALEKLNHAARKTGADLGVELADAQREVARLRGLFEEVQARQSAIDETNLQLRTELETKLQEVDARLKALDGAAQEAQKKAEKPTTKEGVYGLAQEKIQKGDAAGARTLFSEFLSRWPKDALAANSQYWIGESYYGEKKYKEAISEFRKVGENYPKSDKVPDATLKIGFSFAELGLKAEARLFLDEVVRSHPKSNAAKLAKSKINELK